jgi:hypothetical protein
MLAAPEGPTQKHSAFAPRGGPAPEQRNSGYSCRHPIRNRTSQPCGMGLVSYRPPHLMSGFGWRTDIHAEVAQRQRQPNAKWWRSSGGCW